jgi:hypothetical protein
MPRLKQSRIQIPFFPCDFTCPRFDRHYHHTHFNIFLEEKGLAPAPLKKPQVLHQKVSIALGGLQHRNLKNLESNAFLATYYSNRLQAKFQLKRTSNIHN